MKQILVRVQPDFTGIETLNDRLVLNRVGEQYRDTLHFCINGTVASHEAGNWDNANIVIFSNPEEITAPVSGVRLEDTWFHSGNNGLDLGESSILLAPEGTTVSEELKNKVVFYPKGVTTDEQLQNRTTAVNKMLNTLGVNNDNIYPIGRNGVYKNDFPLPLNEYSQLCDELASKFKAGGPATQNQHANTLDGNLESTVPYFLNELNYAKNFGDLKRLSSGVDAEVISKALIDIDEKFQNIEKAKNELNGYSSNYYYNLTEKLLDIKKEFVELGISYAKVLEKPFELMLDGKSLGIKSEKEINLFIIDLWNNNQGTLFNKIEILYKPLVKGEVNKNIGTLSDVFDKEVFSIKRSGPPGMPILEQNNSFIIPPPPPTIKSIDDSLKMCDSIRDKAKTNSFKKSDKNSI